MLAHLVLYAQLVMLACALFTPPPATTVLCVLSALGSLVVGTLMRSPLLQATGLAVALYILWNGTGGTRRRVTAFLGNKARALRDAIVRQLRRSAVPRPVRALAQAG